MASANHLKLELLSDDSSKMALADEGTRGAMDIGPTDRTYKVIALARRVANGRHAGNISTLDILHGLAMEGSGVAANVLKRLGIHIARASQIRWTYEATRAELASLCGEASELMRRAEADARECRKHWPKQESRFAWLGTEHILLAMTTGKDETATVLLRQELASAGLTLEDLRRAVLELIGLGPRPPTPTRPVSADQSLFSTEEAAKICKVSRRTIIRLFDEGRLEGIRKGGSGRRRIPRKNLRDFMLASGIPTDALDAGAS